jgi:hypothetical protein
MSRILSMLSLFALFTAVSASVGDADVESRPQRFWAEAGDGVSKRSEGRHDRHKHKDKHKDDGKGEESVCHKWDWRKKSLKLLVEMPAAGRFLRNPS